MIFGTMGNYLKQRQMLIKFQIKKENGELMRTEPSPQSIRLQETRDSLKTTRINAITNKLKMGKKLSTEELSFLRQNAPTVYQKAVAIKHERERYEKQLKNAKTKKEAQKLYDEAMKGFLQEIKGVEKSGLSTGEKRDAVEFIGMRMAAIQDAHTAFRASERYARLPEGEEDAQPKPKPEPEKRTKRKKIEAIA